MRSSRRGRECRKSGARGELTGREQAGQELVEARAFPDSFEARDARAEELQPLRVGREVVRHDDRRRRTQGRRESVGDVEALAVREVLRRARRVPAEPRVEAPSRARRAAPAASGRRRRRGTPRRRRPGAAGSSPPPASAARTNSAAPSRDPLERRACTRSRPRRRVCAPAHGAGAAASSMTMRLA